MDKEIWRDVVGYEGLYMVSNLGRVKRVGRNHGAKVGRILKTNIGTNGYQQVILSKKSKLKTCRVHRLVADAFIPKIAGKEHVNHKDGDRTNNLLENLEWCTISENAHHKYDVLGYKKPTVKPESKTRKLSIKDVLSIFNSSGSYAEIAKRFGISDVMARNIKLGKCWSDVTCQ